MNKPVFLKKINEEKNYPYFFKNHNIDDNTYIVQKCNSIENGLFIIDVWNKERYNIGNESNLELSGDTKHILIRYINNMNMEIENVNGGDDDYKIVIYRNNDRDYYSALLKFN